jgi:hypothetical protein
MTSLQLSGSAPPDRGLHPKLATIVDRRGTSTENAQKEVSPGGRKVGISCELMGSSLLSRLYFLTSVLRSLR